MEEPGRPRVRLGDRPRRAPARRLARITKFLLVVTLVIGAGLATVLVGARGSAWIVAIGGALLFTVKGAETNVTPLAVSLG